MHGKGTHKELSGFIFDRMADFASSPNNYTEWYRDEAIMHFKILHDLVSGLKHPE